MKFRLMLLVLFVVFFYLFVMASNSNVYLISGLGATICCIVLWIIGGIIYYEIKEDHKVDK